MRVEPVSVVLLPRTVVKGVHEDQRMLNLEQSYAINGPQTPGAPPTETLSGDLPALTLCLFPLAVVKPVTFSYIPLLYRSYHTGRYTYVLLTSGSR